MWLMAAEHIRPFQPVGHPQIEAQAEPAPGRRVRCPVTRPEPLFPRAAANPILTAADVPYPANSVFNPGAARVADETILLVRVEDLRGISQLHVVRSADGVTDWRLDAEPLLQPTSTAIRRRPGAARTRG